MTTPLSKKIEEHALSLGSKGKIDLARISLKFGKKLNLATPEDNSKLSMLAKEILNLSVS